MFLRAIAGRTVFIWPSLHLAFAFFYQLSAQASPGGRPAVPFPWLPAAAAVWVMLLTGALGLLDSRRRSEHLLLANLGVPIIAVALLYASLAGVGELALGLARP